MPNEGETVDLTNMPDNMRHLFYMCMAQEKEFPYGIMMPLSVAIKCIRIYYGREKLNA